MSVGVGLVERGRIYLGADSACVGESVELLDRPKVRRRGRLLVAVAGDMKAVGLVLDGMVLPQYEEGPINEWAVNVLQPSIAESLTRADDWTVLVGVPAHGGKLVAVDSAGNCVVHARRYAAIGSGEPYALGVLFSGAVGWHRLDPRKRVTRAISAASEHDSACAGRICVLSTPAR